MKPKQEPPTSAIRSHLGSALPHRPPSALATLTFHLLKRQLTALHLFIFPVSILAVVLRQTYNLLLSQPENHLTWSMREWIQLWHKGEEMSELNCFANTPCQSAENPPVQRQVNDLSVLTCVYWITPHVEVLYLFLRLFCWDRGRTLFGIKLKYLTMIVNNQHVFKRDFGQRACKQSTPTTTSG